MSQCPYCDYDGQGSHYHCARCKKVTSMMGHYVQLKSAADSWARDLAAKIGVTIPWEGFSCDPNNERRPAAEGEFDG